MISVSPIIFKSLLSKIDYSREECCGFIIGRPSEEFNRVDSFFQVENISDDDRSKVFEISSKDYLATEKLATCKGLSILGIYHSHINHPAVPSELDRKFAFPGFSYLIISFIKFTFSEVKSWKIDENRNFNEESIVFNK